MKYNLFACLAFLALSGCAQNVLVKHHSNPEKIPQNEIYRTSRIYLVSQVEPQDSPSKSTLMKALDILGSFAPSKTKESYDYPLKRTDLIEIAKTAADRISRAGSEVVSYQVSYSTHSIPWALEFSPTSSLWLKPSDFKATQQHQGYTVKTEEGERKVHKYTTKVDFSLEWILRREPEQSVLVKGKYPFYGGAVLTEEKTIEESDLEEFLKSRMSTIVSKTLKQMEQEILPHEVETWRKIFKNKKGEMGAAFRHAQYREWDQASKIWREILQKEPNHWESNYNLGILHEMRSEWNQAKNLYQIAFKFAPQSKKKMITTILEELDRLTSPLSASADKSFAFYKKKIAVLPLTNESVDVRGVDYMRLKLIEELGGMGYTLLPMAEIDQKLKEKGVLEGGHLNVLSPKGWAKHLGTEWILYGNIEEFRVMNVGIYFKRQVRLALKLFNKEGELIWQNTGQTITQSGVRHEEAAESFFINLAATQIQKVAKTYLKEESDETILRALETLPRILR